ncbi:putative allophanate hydrolase subunit 1 [gamma proteobacterium HdN1]|nr:putative allophanate hydrolase subunit 1 [gamma proteobacterium HdN1]
MREYTSSTVAPKVIPLGDSAFLLYFNAQCASTAESMVLGYQKALKVAAPAWLIELVPAPDTLYLQYDPYLLHQRGGAYAEWLAWLTALPYQPLQLEMRRSHTLPICYAPEFGIDLEFIATVLKLSVSEIVHLHCGASYRVQMIGFAPGFPYLTGLPAALQMPRRATPRTRLPAGSVAVADQRCGIYPAALPGGWHVLGRTPTTLFDPNQSELCLLSMGDTVRFVEIDLPTFKALAK